MRDWVRLPCRRACPDCARKSVPLRCPGSDQARTLLACHMRTRAGRRLGTACSKSASGPGFTGGSARSNIMSASSPQVSGLVRAAPGARIMPHTGRYLGGETDRGSRRIGVKKNAHRAAVRRGWRVDADHCAGDADPGILRATRRSRARDHIPETLRHTGAGWSWPHRCGGASRVRKSIVPPGCWPTERAGGRGASALREAGRIGSPDECTIRACGSAVPGPAASAGLTRFAPSAIASRLRRRRNAPSRIPPSPPACCAGRETDGRQRCRTAGVMTVPGVTRWRRRRCRSAVKATGNYPVASSSASARRARISPMARSRLSVSGSGSRAWIW